MEQIFGQLVAGLYAASLLFLLSMGLTLAFGVADFFNFAHGAFFVLGGYGTFAAATSLGLPLPLAVAAGVALAALVGLGFDLTVLRRYERRGMTIEIQILSSYGLLLLLEDVVRWAWGSGYVATRLPASLEAPLHIGNTQFAIYHVVVVGVSCLVLAVLDILVRHSTSGLLIRAATDDPERLARLGGRPRLVLRGVMVVGAALAGLGGALAMPLSAMTPSSGDRLVLPALIVTVIGGRGNLRGAALASLLVAELSALGVLALPALAPALPYLVALAVLGLRPTGLARPSFSEAGSARV